MHANGNLKEAKTLSDLLPYLGVDPIDGGLCLKDGSVTRSFRLVPKSCLTATEADLEGLRSSLIRALSSLPEGVIAQVWMSRSQPSGLNSQAIVNWNQSHQPDGKATPCGRQKLFEARQALTRSCEDGGTVFQTEIFVTLRVSPEIKAQPLARMGAFAHLAFWHKAGKAKSVQDKTPRTIVQELNAAAEGFLMGLESAGIEASPLLEVEQAARIAAFFNPDREVEVLGEEEVVVHRQNLSERVTLTDLIESKSGLALGKTRIRIGTLKSLPESTVPALMHILSGQRVSFDAVVTIMVLPQVPERERLSRKQRLAQGMASGNQVRNLYAEGQLQEIENTLGAMIGRGERLVVASFHLITRERGEVARGELDILLDEGARLGPGCQWFEETVGAYPVFFGILPFAPTFITRPKRILTPALTDLLPLYGSGPGHVEASVLFETLDQGIMGYSLFEKSPSGNAILIGSTGSGKSTLACGLILGMNAGGSSAAPSSFVIDVGNSFRRSLLYLGGTSLDLSPENGTVINPFDLPVGEKYPNPEKVKFLTAFFDEILGDCGSLTKLERALLEGEIFVFYRKDEPPTLSRFKAHLESADHPDLKRLAKLLILWCKPQPYGLLFDGTTNVTLDGPHLHFELKGCQRYPDLLRVAMLVVMDLIWREVRARFPKRSLVVVDEAHTLIRPSSDGRANGAARWVEDGFRQMRKFSSAAIAISQTAKDLKSPEIGDGILANAPNRFILRQRGDEVTLREDLKLNERELAEVFALSQVRGEFSEFFLHSESIKGTFRYRPTPLELWLSTTHPPDLSALKEAENQHPEWSLIELMDYLATKYPEGAEGRMV
ncbi:hypothetical protein WDW37_08925 [Bdellovibrionota bacterium FG-1]